MLVNNELSTDKEEMMCGFKCNIHSTPVQRDVGRANRVVLLLCTFGLFIFAGTVNSETFARILFSRIALKDDDKTSLLRHNLATSVND